jgi:hypothetical protein
MNFELVQSRTKQATPVFQIGLCGAGVAVIRSKEQRYPVAKRTMGKAGWNMMGSSDRVRSRGSVWPGAHASLGCVICRGKYSLERATNLRALPPCALGAGDQPSL